jgi:hypothetical protein
VFEEVDKEHWRMMKRRVYLDKRPWAKELTALCTLHEENETLCIADHILGKRGHKKLSQEIWEISYEDCNKTLSIRDYLKETWGLTDRTVFIAERLLKPFIVV